MDMKGTAFFKKDFIYLFIDTQREAETQAEGEAGSMQEALDPGSPGSHPRLQAAPNRCATRAAR